MDVNKPQDANERPEQAIADQVQATKAEIAERLRYLRQQHPEGPFTLGELAERAGLSKRTLVSAESPEGANLTIETLLKVAHSLGIRRPAYFLDEQVFQQVKRELDTVKELRRRNVRSVALRAAHTSEPSGPAGPPADQVAQLLAGIIDSAAKARNALGNLPPDPSSGQGCSGEPQC
ncbi:helix-turn-helix domain-containing protein [Streptomyces sp. NPDC087300]|uniref:helix-turn-helix domain-containing protein n=1 Tax=Streptomyces sp. NPDC087300 TaxID=3365780 RepID=UPI0037F12AA4